MMSKPITAQIIDWPARAQGRVSGRTGDQIEHYAYKGADDPKAFVRWFIDNAALAQTADDLQELEDQNKAVISALSEMDYAPIGAAISARMLIVAPPPPSEQSVRKRGWFAQVPEAAFSAREPGRGKRNHVRWKYIASELRYLGEVCAHTANDGYCRAPQEKLAGRLDIGRRQASKLEKALIKKGILESTRLGRRGGRWGCRILRVIYDNWEPQSERVEASGSPPSVNDAEAARDDPSSIKTESTSGGRTGQVE